MQSGSMMAQVTGQYRHILKVAEELLYNACPSDLISKYERFKAMALVRIDEITSSEQQQLYTVSQPSVRPCPSEKFSLSFLESVMETAGLFVDSMQGRAYSNGITFSRSIQQFEEMTATMISGLYKRCAMLATRPTSHLSTFEKLILCMQRALIEQDKVITAGESGLASLRELQETHMNVIG